MPSLPRIKRVRQRGRAEEPVLRSRREPAELSANGLTWVHLDAPETATAAELAERFGWHALDVEDVLSKRQRPKVDEYPNYLFAVLHFPFYDKAVQRLNAAELDVFVGPGYLVTLPNVELLPVTRLFQRCSDDAALRESLFSKSSGYLLYHVLDDLFDYCFPPEELELYFDDLVDASERIWDLLDNYKEVVEALEATNESAISHRQNDVLRVLTIFASIMLPLTLITGIFGMNVRFPGIDTAAAFWVIVGAMAAALAGLVGF